MIRYGTPIRQGTKVPKLKNPTKKNTNPQVTTACRGYKKPTAQHNHRHSMRVCAYAHVYARARACACVRVRAYNQKFATRNPAPGEYPRVRIRPLPRIGAQASYVFCLFDSLLCCRIVSGTSVSNSHPELIFGGFCLPLVRDDRGRVILYGNPRTRRETQ